MPDIFDEIEIAETPRRDIFDQIGDETELSPESMAPLGESITQDEAQRQAIGRGMESGTEFLTEVASDPVGFAKAIPEIVTGAIAAPGRLAYDTAADVISAITPKNVEVTGPGRGDFVTRDLTSQFGGNLRAGMTGQPKPADTFLGEVSRTNPKLAVAGKIGRDLTTMAPLGVVAALPAGLARLATAGFSAQMIAHAPALFKDYAEEIAKPTEEQDTDKLTELKSGIIQTFAFAPLAGAHASRGVPAEISAMLDKAAARLVPPPGRVEAPRVRREMPVEEGAPIPERVMPPQDRVAPIEGQIEPPTPVAEVKKTRATVTRWGKKKGDKYDDGNPEKVVAMRDDTSGKLNPEYTVKEYLEVLSDKEVELRKRDMTPDEIKEHQSRLEKENEMARELGLPLREIPKPQLDPTTDIRKAPTPIAETPAIRESRISEPRVFFDEAVGKYTATVFHDKWGNMIGTGETPEVAAAALNQHIANADRHGTWRSVNHPKTVSAKNAQAQPTSLLTESGEKRQGGEVKQSLGVPPIVSEMILTAQKSVEAFKERITNVRQAPYVEGQKFDTILFDVDGKTFKGELKGRNRDLLIGSGLPQDRAIAARVFLDQHAAPFEPTAAPKPPTPPPQIQGRGGEKTYSFSESDVRESKPQVERRKRPNGDDITTRVEVNSPLEVTDSKNWPYVNSDHIRYTVEARGVFETRQAPKKAEKVWRVWNPKTKEFLATGLTYKEAIAFAKKAMVENNFGVKNEPPPPTPTGIPRLAGRGERESSATAQESTTGEGLGIGGVRQEGGGGSPEARPSAVQQQSGTGKLEAESGVAGVGVQAARGTAAEQGLVSGTERPVTPTPEIKGMGGAVPSEFKPNLQTATGIKNAAMEKELARLGMPGILEAQRQSNQALWDRVMAKIDLDPAWQDVLISDLKKKTRQLTDEEVFALDHRLVDLKVEHAKATREAAQAYDDGRMDAVKEAGERAQHWSNQIKELSEITKLAGTEWGRAGQARQRLLNEDYSLAALEMQKREANDWRPITDAERIEIQKTHDAYQAKLKEFEAQLEQKGRELVDAEIARALAESKATPQYSPKVLQYAEKFSLYMDELGSSALARIKARQAAAAKGIMGRGAGVDPVELIDLSIYGASKITRGLVDSVKWADAMVRDVGEWIKPHLDEIFKASNAMVDERLAGFVKAAPEAEAVKRVVKKRDAAEKIDLATSSIEAKVKKGELDAVASDVQKLVRAIVERDPKIEREALINEVQDILKSFIPEITRLEAMDAISTRGKYTLPSEDVISAKVADLKTQIRLMGHQMDVEARKPLPPTGLQRRPLSDAARREVQRLNELKRKFGVVVTDMAKHLASVLDSQKTYYRNRLADLRHEIKTREKIVKSKTPAPTDLELEALRQEYKQTKADRDSIFETPGLTDLQRVELAERSTTRQIAVLERQKETGEIFPKSKQPLKLTSAKLEANKQIIAALKAEREWARDALQPKPERDPAVTALKAKTAALSRELEYWSGKLARGDFRPRTRKPPLDISGDAKAMRLLGEVESIKHKWKHGLYLDNMANRSRMQKVWHGIRQGKDAFVNLLSSFDLSAPRQAFLYLLANLSRVITNPSSAKRLLGDPFVKMYQAMKSESVANGIEQWRMNRPNAKSGADKQMGIQYTELKTTDFTKWEDRAHSILDEWAEAPMRTGSAIKTAATAIPKAGSKGVRMSNRAFITFLNSARANLADYLLEVNFKDRPPTAADLKVIGNLVNISTGRGNLNRGVAKVTGELLWSPSLLASRLQALSGQPLWGAAEWAGSGRARKIVAKEYVRWILSIVALYSVSRLFSDKRESDSTSSDFGKVARGDTRIDPWAGFQQPIVAGSRLAKGITTGISGKKRDISDFGTGEVIWNFFKNKARPDVAAIVKTAIAAIDSGKPASKVRVTVGDAASAWVPVPLSVQEIIAVMRDRGMTEGAIIQVLATFGAGVSTYEEREKQR